MQRVIRQIAGRIDVDDFLKFRHALLQASERNHRLADAILRVIGKQMLRVRADEAVKRGGGVVIGMPRKQAFREMIFGERHERAGRIFLLKRAENFFRFLRLVQF